MQDNQRQDEIRVQVMPPGEPANGSLGDIARQRAVFKKVIRLDEQSGDRLRGYGQQHQHYRDGTEWIMSRCAAGLALPYMAKIFQQITGCRQQ